MKKTILTLFFILGTLFSFSQEKISLPTYKSAIARWNILKQEYDVENTKYSNLIFEFHDKFVTVNDISRSIYRIVETPVNESTSKAEVMAAKCLDEQNRECTIKLIKEEKQSFIMIIYEKFVIIYYVGYL